MEEPWVKRPRLVPCEAHASPDKAYVLVDYHPFVASALCAFDAHRPLSLSPDHVWVLLVQGLSEHIRQDPESVRGRFVQHAGKLKIEVRRDDFSPGGANPWEEVIGAFSEKVREHIGKRHDLLVCDFSTTGPIERTASEVTMLAALSPYFELGLLSLCGIPSITLEGTPEDWRSIRTRARVFREFGLDAWVDHLEPALDHFVRASEGRADAETWRSFVKRKNASGGPYITGWINLLMPYLHDQSAKSAVKNRFLTTWAEGLDTPFGGGPTTEELPAALSSAPFTWRYLAEKLPMELLGGFVGVSQDPDAGTLRPELGWAVRSKGPEPE
ncbi:MAG: hypothetical protein DRJ42_12880 [Deltaproteobacteria bacterium]|nr:MAG: hypothetical protein DRJ42_12880 [Deltaproteobacteria bacterium]